MNKLKIAIRVDASLKIGSGHVMRCISLANELTRSGSECVFITRTQKGNLTELLTEKGYEIYLLPPHLEGSSISIARSSASCANWLGCSWEHDAEQTSYALTKIKPDWLIVDNYGLDANWEQAVNSGDLKLMIIDDLVLVDRNRPRSSPGAGSNVG